MDQKAFTIVFVIVLVIAVAGLGISKLGESSSRSSSPNPSASASSSGFKLNQSSPNNALGDQPQAQNSQTQKPIKQYRTVPAILSADQLANKKAVIQTDKGSIEFEIYADAPQAASNFIFLASDKFYDGLTFHRVEKAPSPFVIQGGDPVGNGTGGPGYKFADEPVTKSYSKGIVAMANSGPNTNGSQFFIMLDDHPELPKKYTIFGKVVSGQDVVDKIAVGDVMRSVTIVPLQ